jgi:hypothetical protein
MIEVHLHPTKVIGLALMDGQLVKVLGLMPGRVDSLVGIYGELVLTTLKVLELFTLKALYLGNTMHHLTVERLMDG